MDRSHSSEHILPKHAPAFVIAYIVPSDSFNDAQALEHDNIYFRSADVITVGGLYFS
jgi:hypothetical protein